jgi:hypothetical protein
MKNLLLATTAFYFGLASPVFAQTMPSASITAQSASEGDLAALRSILGTNVEERLPLVSKVDVAQSKAAETARALQEILNRLANPKEMLKPARPLSRDELIAIVEKYFLAEGYTPSMAHENGVHYTDTDQVHWTGYDNSAELKVQLHANTQAVNAAKTALTAFDGKIAKTAALAKAVAANIDVAKAHDEQVAAEEQRKADEAAAKVREEKAEAEAKARAEEAVRTAEAEIARATTEKLAAEEAAKVEAQAAAKRVEAATIRQKAAEARQAAADATAAAKAEEVRASAKERDAETAEAIAKAPASPDACMRRRHRPGIARIDHRTSPRIDH